MRSELVFRALVQVSNRYRLCQLTTKATRKFHKPHSRLPETISEVMSHFHRTNPQAKTFDQAPAAPPMQKRRPAARSPLRLKNVPGI